MGRTLHEVFRARLLTGDAVAATIAHEVKRPLSGMITNADAGLRWLDRPTPDLDEARAAFKQIAADGHRAGAVIGSIRAIFKRDARSRTSLDINNLIGEALVFALISSTPHHAVPTAPLPRSIKGGARRGLVNETSWTRKTTHGYAETRETAMAVAIQLAALTSRARTTPSPHNVAFATVVGGTPEEFGTLSPKTAEILVQGAFARPLAIQTTASR